MLQYISKQTSNSLFFLQVRAVGTLLQMAGAHLSFKRACVVCNTTATSVVAHAPTSNAHTLKMSHSDTPLLPLDSHVMRFVTSSFCAGARSSGCTTQRFVGLILFFYALWYRCGFVKPTGCAAYNVQLPVLFLVFSCSKLQPAITRSYSVHRQNPDVRLPIKCHFAP